MAIKERKYAVSVSKDIYEWLGKVQAGFKFRYNKTVSQLQILLHINRDEVKSDNYDKIIDDLYVKIEEQAKNDKVISDKKKEINSI